MLSMEGGVPIAAHGRRQIMAGQRASGKPEKKKGAVSIREGAEMESPGSARPDAAPGSATAEPAAGHGRVDDASEWLFQQIERSGSLPLQIKAPEAAGAVLCTLSRRLRDVDAQNLARALPPTLRGVVQPCALHRDEQAELFGREQFLDTLAKHLQTPVDEAATVARTVFAVIQGHMSREEISMIEAELPMDLRDLWRPRLAA
jgi:uncharacterized protein (DUF2267 family)